MSAGGSKSWLFDVSPGADHSLIEEALSFPRVVRAQYTPLYDLDFLSVPPPLSSCAIHNRARTALRDAWPNIYS